jgi:hypothetical protein
MAYGEENDLETDSDEEYEDACDLFEAFHGREPDENSDEILETEDGQILLYVGELEGVMYQKPGTKEPYLHRFSAPPHTKKDRPLLYIHCDGQMVIVQGNYTFTERGFE